MEVRLLTEQDYVAWQDYVANFPHAGFFHQIGWLKVVVDTYGHKPLYLIAEDGGAVKGVLPLFFISSPIFGRFLASDVFTSYGGVCADNEQVASSLMEKAKELAKSHNVEYVEVKNLKPLNSINAEWKKKNVYCTLMLDLKPGANEIWKAWRGETRTHVRKAIKSNVVVESGHHLYDEFYKLAAIFMRRVGTPIHSKKFYSNILKHFGEAANIFVAKINGEIVSATFTASHKNIIQAYANVSLLEYRTKNPNQLLCWEIIRHACEKGFEYLDFGRSTYDSGTFSYKKQMIGAEPVPLHYIYYLNKLEKIPHVHPENKRYQLAIKIWQKLPLQITKIIGPHIIKYVV